MNLTYLVDLENIGIKPLRQYVEHGQEGEYIIFYSDNTPMPGALLEQLPDNIHIAFVNCRTGGNNAMDFCICAMAGKLSTDRTGKIKILSNDKGYDAMVRMLQEQGTRITRDGVMSHPEQREEPSQSTRSIDENGIAAIIQKNVPKKYQNMLQNEMLHVMSRKEAHEICQAVLPKSLATEVYRKIKKFIPKEVN